MKNVIIALGALLLVGCDSYSKSLDSDYTLPPELSDCKIVKLVGSGMSKDLYVVRCPNSSTTTRYHCGKSCEQSVTTVDY
ncbi:hypothetical protein AHP1_451 [Aeromonas phage Ahp1_CNU-2021]|nr:hypothetical protein AHP1_451 [Aeromonas phage Ahp1_CNU-2021]